MIFANVEYAGKRKQTAGVDAGRLRPKRPADGQPS
jgi:hypothetical protein